MKRFIQFFSFIALAFVFSTVSAQAQSVTKVEANVPFDFKIGENSFSSGTYEIRIVNSASGSARVLLTDENGDRTHSAIVLRNGESVGSRAELVFNVEGSTRTLAGITTNDAGYSLPKFRKSRSVTIRASVPLRKAAERN